MAFESKQTVENGLHITELIHTENQTRIQILPEAGALFHGWILERNGQSINLIDHYVDADDLAANLTDSYKSANLSPFACRIPEGKYTYQGQTYEFVHKFSDGNAIHGLLADKPFQAGDVHETGQQISAAFRYAYRKDDGGYPFNYDCTVVYTLHADNRVTLETTVKNISDRTIPIVDGWHPYFTTGSRVNDCQLQFFSKEVIEFDDRLIPTGELTPYRAYEKARLLGDTELDHSFLVDEKAPQPKCTFSDPNRGISLQFYPSEHYPVLQIYTPPHRNSIAIETLSGAPDAFNNGIGLILLEPGESQVFSVTYGVVMAEGGA